MVVTRVLNIFALAFIAAFSGMLMLAVDWAGLHNPCIVERKCDILEVAFHRHPLWDHPSWWTASVTAYLALLGVYFLWSMIHLVEDLRDATEIRHFYRNRLGISDRLMATMTWPEVLQRIVLLQQHIRLCIVRDLTAHDICARIMRRENFLIGMLNKVTLPCFPRRLQPGAPHLPLGAYPVACALGEPCRRGLNPSRSSRVSIGHGAANKDLLVDD